MTKGEYYALKRRLTGTHTGRYDQAAWRKLKGYKKTNPPGASSAHNKAWRAQKKGLLVQQPCTICGDPNTDKHHPLGYDHPLVVEWMCQPCHQRLENGNKEALTILGNR
jgi:hypothetical protein